MFLLQIKKISRYCISSGEIFLSHPVDLRYYLMADNDSSITMTARTIKLKWLKGVYIFAGNPSHRYGASPAIWDHTVLPTTRHMWTRSALTPARQAGTRFACLGGTEGWVNQDNDVADECKYLLCLSFVGALTLMVDATEVGDDHRDGKSNDKNTAQRTDSAHNLADHRTGHHVSVPACRRDTPAQRHNGISSRTNQSIDHSFVHRSLAQK